MVIMTQKSSPNSTIICRHPPQGAAHLSGMSLEGGGRAEGGGGRERGKEERERGKEERERREGEGRGREERI